MENKQLVLVTGATGFIGKTLCSTLIRQGFDIRALVRSDEKAKELQRYCGNSSNLECFLENNLNEKTDWKNLLEGIDIIVHLAARVHILKDSVKDPLAEYRIANLQMTELLAKMAVKHQVKQFIFLSSIKVNGESTYDNKFSEADMPNPCDHYAISKWEAEQFLNNLAKTSNLKVVILRPPLVYGKGVKANFRNLLNLVEKGMPLPFASIKNSRSMVYSENLVDAIITCIKHHSAHNETFIVSDGEPVSTQELIRAMAYALDKSPRIFPMPKSWLERLGRITDRAALLNRLTSSLVVDDSKIRKLLNWKPKYSLKEALKKDFGKQS